VGVLRGASAQLPPKGGLVDNQRQAGDNAAEAIRVVCTSLRRGSISCLMVGPTTFVRQGVDRAANDLAGAGFGPGTLPERAGRTVEKRQMAEVAMTSPAATSQEVPKRLWQLSQRRVRGVLVLFLGCLALAAPFFAGPLTLFLGGSLLILCGVLEMWETFRAP